MSTVKLGFCASEVIKKGRITQHEIEELKLWLNTQSLPDLTEEQIIIFLIACGRDQNAAQATITSFYSVRKVLKELFVNRKVFLEDIQQQLRTVNVCLLPKRTADNCAIICQGLYDSDYRNLDMKVMTKIGLMTLEAAYYDDPPKGVIFIYDMKNFGLRHLSKVKINIIPPYCKYFQEGLPVKLLQTHVFNSFYVLDMFLKLMSPFMNEEVKQIIHLHKPNADMNDFYEKWIPKKYLPEDYGGDLPSIRECHEMNVKKLLEMESYFEAEEIQRASVNM